MSATPYTLDPLVQAFLTRFPPIGPFDRNRCPDCHHWAVVDIGRQEVVCYRHDPTRIWTLAERLALADQAQADRPRLPDSLKRYYPGGVVCPTDHTRLALRLRQQEGTCPQCTRIWTFTELEDAAAAALMQEAPRGATPYRKPRHPR